LRLSRSASERTAATRRSTRPAALRRLSISLFPRVVRNRRFTRASDADLSRRTHPCAPCR
jgi:hypothetical protein